MMQLKRRGNGAVAASSFRRISSRLWRAVGNMKKRSWRSTHERRRRLRVFARTLVLAARAASNLQHAVTEEQAQLRRCREEGTATKVQLHLDKELVRMKR